MIEFTERLDKAVRVAAWAHERQGQHRKGSDIPYIVHPFGVMVIAGNVTQDEDVLIACLLHDILEDVDPAIYSEQDMREDFGERAARMVQDVTKDDSIKDWRERSKAYLGHLEQGASDEAVLVSAADKIHNLAAILTDYKEAGEQLWQRFATNSGADQLWWYESVLAVVKKRLPGSPLATELEGLTGQLSKVLNQK